MAAEVGDVGRIQWASKKNRADAGLADDACRPLAVEQCRKLLVELFPGRKDEIEELLSILGEPTDLFPPLFLYGGVATGKTTLLRETMAFLKRPFAYVPCRTCHNPRLVFESVLNQLVGHIRCKANNYASAKKCERMVDFVSQLFEVCANKSTTAESRGGEREVVYLIFDNVELVREWAGEAGFLSSLVSLSSLTRLPNLGLIFISNAGPDTFQFGTACRDVLPLYFRGYTNEEMHSILIKWHPNPELFSSFLKTYLPPFSRTSRTLTELSKGLQPLYEKYCESIRQGKGKPQGSHELFTSLKGHMQQALSQTYSVTDCDINGKAAKETRKGRLERSLPSSAMGFHLSLCSKHLLLASYIASQNPSTHDDALFGTADAEKSKKRKRKSSMSAMERTDADLHEKRLKGPSNCPLERLLAIYQCVAMESSLASEDVGMGDSSVGHEKGNGKDVTADVLMQLASLTSVSLVLKSSSSPLDGIPRFRSNVDTDFIHKVASSIHFPLSKYLLHG